MAKLARKERPTVTVDSDAEEQVFVGSGNVYSDLGYPDADEMLAKATLVNAILGVMKERKLTQTTVASLVGIDQPTLSKLLRGQFRSISIGRLISILNGLDQDVEIRIQSKPANVDRKAQTSVSVAHVL